jgi:cell division protein FtsQ
MKNRLQSILETRKYRFKRRKKDLIREVSKALGLLLAVLTITAAMIQGCHYVVTLPYFQIKETVVKGCTELTEKDVLTLAAIKYPQSLFAINTDAIVKRISSNPWIKSVFIGRELPNRLVIEIREKMAIALVKKDSVFYLLDADGTPFKKLQSGEDTDLPVLNGCYPEGKLDDHLLTKSLELLRVLSDLKDLPAVSHVSEINGHEILGLSLFTDSGLCLHLGFDNYENKLKRLVPVMDDLGRRNLKPGFLLIDLSDPAKITVQQKNIFGPSEPARSNKELRT